MKASIRKLVAILSVVAAFAVVMPFAASDAYAQQKAANTAKQLIGHWSLVSVKLEQDGKTTEPWGPNPKGLFIFDRSGRYAILIFCSDLPKFASNSIDTGSPEENKAVVTGSMAHFGTYSANEKEGSFSIRPEAGTFPNWVGIDQPKRSFSVSKDELKITNPAGPRGGPRR
jgi:Lipocalin-like domain